MSEQFVPRTLEEVEKEHILLTLAHCDGNVGKAASLLGVSFKTVYNKLHKYGVPTKSTANG